MSLLNVSRIDGEQLSPVSGCGLMVKGMPCHFISFMVLMFKSEFIHMSTFFLQNNLGC